ncbi:DUF1800 domain-containing protein [Paracoccus sp. CPCC 101403]|uniref:DUF1800 domain-containing protein n=1 Tax=Paracoccus broussonetiae TaxID=3075834 RepID=A0ABU3EFA9_9RHOB|nr:DUF1800 domain-containing protein [Paracoccus sp. CPCC 101403]MDT1062918.1 DUF1800 domain-containing protein [Paracoccus sp. CPCC 101403]
MVFDSPQAAAIRLGYGLSPLTPPPPSPVALLQGIAASTRTGAEAVSTAQAQKRALRLNELRKARDSGEAAKEEFQAYNVENSRLTVRDLQRRLARAVEDPTGFGERLAQFWSDHFTVRPDGVQTNALAMAFHDEAIRPHINGRFEDLFFAADTHPMMLVYLNQNTSRGPNSQMARRRAEKAFGLNENLAREAMELHSLGVGAPYTQRDVRELAELMTGLSYSAKDGFSYRPQIAEPGAETVLGKSYGGKGPGELRDIRAAFRDIARRPETAQFVSRKLAVHFVSDSPSPELVDAMAATWRDTNGQLPQVYRVMLTHPETMASLRAKVRQPFDLMVAGFRALGVTGDQVRHLDFPNLPGLTANHMMLMGQPWLRPTGPDGWAEGPEAWIEPQLLAARISWAMRAPRNLVPQLPDPRELLDTALGDTRSDQLAWAVPKAESQAEGVALVLASNDFNRR